MAGPDYPKPGDVRLSKKGLESPSGKGKVQGGFGDTKKVLVLVGLAVVALGVVAYQFIGGSGPTPAKAKTKAAPPPAAATPALSATETSAALKAVEGAASGNKEDGLSVDRVENLVRKFDTYVQERQIPLASLRVNPFQVVRTATIEPAEQAAREQADAEAEAEARRQRILQAASQLKLGTILIAGTARTAVIGGRLYQVGDVVEGMRVDAISRDHVTLAYDGDTVDLRLRPESRSP